MVQSFSCSYHRCSDTTGSSFSSRKSGILSPSCNIGVCEVSGPLGFLNWSWCHLSVLLSCSSISKDMVPEFLKFMVTTFLLLHNFFTRCAQNGKYTEETLTLSKHSCYFTTLIIKGWLEPSYWFCHVMYAHLIPFTSDQLLILHQRLLS